MSNLTRIIIVMWLIIGCSVGSTTPCIADAVVTLHGETELHRATVKLSDLFNGVPDDIDREIAQAPLPGKQAIYDYKVLAQLADKYHLEWHPGSYTDHVTINTACTHISTDMLRQAVAQKAKESGARGTVEVNFDNHALAFDLPADQSSSFTLNNYDYDPVSKHFRVDFVPDGSQGYAAIPITGRMVLKLRVPVLAHRLEIGSVIDASDIDWVDVAEDRVNDATITDAKSLVGHELRHVVAEGDVVRVSDVMAPRLVKRGTTITMKIETNIMSLTTQGRALQDGTRGDTVRVMNLQSNRVVEGTVDDDGTVTISTTRKLALAE
jgi:flagella basal body P-ring formation protein FlgA